MSRIRGIAGAAVLAAAGAAVLRAVAGRRDPEPTVPVGLPTLLDRYLPAYEFSSVYATAVAAEPARAYRAVLEMPAHDLGAWSRLLLGARALPARVAGSAEPRPPAGTRPLLDTMSDLGFVMLDRTPDREVVFGVVGQFWRARGVEQPHLSTPDEFLSFDDPRFAKVAANVAVRPGPRPGTSLVHTETRVHVPDPLLRRRFARYWRLIGGGSGFIRRQWLAGIKRRAERVSDPGSSGEE